MSEPERRDASAEKQITMRCRGGFQRAQTSEPATMPAAIRLKSRP